MRRIIITFLLIAIVFNVAKAKPIDEEIARKVATNFILNKTNSYRTVKGIIKEGQTNNPLLFVVYFEEGGWVIVSGDDETEPVLGYSSEGEIKNQAINRPDAFNLWIKKYSKGIENIRSTNQNDRKFIDKWDKIISNKRLKSFTYTAGDILLNTPRGNIAWSQDINNDGDCGIPYNKFCPSCSNSNCDCNRYAAGCGAVALGTIMWYWQWPNRASIPFYEYGGILLPHSYDWDLMPPELLLTSTVDEGDEVARLLSDIGRAVGMNYWAQGPWATASNLENALKNNFHYKSAELKKRKDYNDDVWQQMMRNEIDAGRPFVYHGGEILWEGDIHYFVCDGYDATDNNLFHFNFGWGWPGNPWNIGYFFINDLTPGTHDFDDNQKMIIGIHPTCNDIPENITDLSYQTVGNNSFGHEQAKSNINLPASGKELVVQSGGKLILTAGNSIKLGPGFKAEVGSEFRAEIEQICDNCENEHIQIVKYAEGFSPNGDGINDELCYIVNNATSFEFVAIDRYDHVVFRNSGTATEDTVCVWNGTGACNLCSYAVIITFRNDCDEVNEIAHMVTVVAALPKSAKINSISSKEVVNIDEIEQITPTNDVLKICPNPTSGIFSIQLVSNAEDYTIQIYDTNGKIVHNQTNQFTNITTVDLSNHPKGVYIVKIVLGDKILSKRIVIN